MRCTSCGEKITDGAKFCKYCGTPVSQSETIKKSKVSMPFKIFIAIFFSVIAVAILCYFSKEFLGERTREERKINRKLEYAVETAAPTAEVSRNPDLEKVAEGNNVSQPISTPIFTLEPQVEDKAETHDIDRTDYILVGSDSRYISKSELRGFSEKQCRLARNELYARHGRKFDDKFLQQYFDSKSWYIPKIDADKFQESTLNAYEIANRNMIVQYEKQHGYSGKKK